MVGRAKGLTMLNLWRRHLAGCEKGQNKGRRYAARNCPVWCDGEFKRRSGNARAFICATETAFRLGGPHEQLFSNGFC